MQTITMTSAEDSKFARYKLATRSLAEYYPVSSRTEFAAEVVACATDIIRTGRRHFVMSGSGSTNVTWITERAQIQRKTVFVRNLGTASLALKGPLPIFLEVAATNVVAYSYDLEELAVSSSESEVLDEMRATIVETYFLLKSEQENLGPLQRRHWAFLKQIISEV